MELEDPVEDAVDEPARLGGAVPLGQLERLVDGDLGRDLGAEEHLVGAQPEDVAVDGGHAVEPPVLGHLRDHLVDLGLVLPDAGDQVLGELDELVVAQEPPVDELADLGDGHAGVLLDLVEHLEGDFTASGASRHDQRASDSTPRRRLEPEQPPARLTAFFPLPPGLRPRCAELGPCAGSRSVHPSIRFHPQKESYAKNTRIGKGWRRKYQAITLF